MAEKTKAEIQTELEEALAKITKLEGDKIKLAEQIEMHKREFGVATQHIKQLEDGDKIRVDKITALKAVIAELKAHPLMAVNAAGVVTEVKLPRAADLPGGIQEADVTQRVRAGLTRKQAIEVITSQLREDAEAAKAAKK